MPRQAPSPHITNHGRQSIKAYRAGRGLRPPADVTLALGDPTARQHREHRRRTRFKPRAKVNGRFYCSVSYHGMQCHSCNCRRSCGSCCELGAAHVVHKGSGLDAGTTQRQARRHSERTSWGAARRPASASRGLVGGSSCAFIVSSPNAGETSLCHPGCERVKHTPHHARGGGGGGGGG